MPQSERWLCGKPGFIRVTFMLTSIFVSIIVLPGITFFIVCLVGFHRAQVSPGPIRAQIERLESDDFADESKALEGSGGYRRTA